jgi:hypothetical protein
MPRRFLPLWYPIRKVDDVVIAITFAFQILILCTGTQQATSFTMYRRIHGISQRVVVGYHPRRNCRVVGGSLCQQWGTIPPGLNSQTSILLDSNELRRSSAPHLISMRCGSSSSSSTTSSDSTGTSSEYEHWVRRLYMTNMFNPVKLGLDNIQQIHDLLGNPMDDVSVTDAYLFEYMPIVDALRETQLFCSIPLFIFVISPT